MKLTIRSAENGFIIEEDPGTFVVGGRQKREYIATGMVELLQNVKVWAIAIEQAKKPRVVKTPQWVHDERKAQGLPPLEKDECKQ